ncbi:MAG: YhjD/YihY/BrkB family envelope integrity protein [Aquihabitans sp.]
MGTNQPNAGGELATEHDAAAAAPSRSKRLRRWGADVADGLGSWVEHRREHWMPLDLAITYYERDREALASVLGSAVALRLYLFFIPALIMGVGLAILLVGQDQVDSALTTVSISGSMAKDISSAVSASDGTGFAFLIGGLWLTVWAGWSLTRVLAACAGRAWRLDPKTSKATMPAVGALTAMLLLLLGCTLLLNRLRERHGIAADTTSWLFTFALVSAGWFVVSWFLPRRTNDPGALLPGAAAFGLALTALQWFMQFYLPRELAQTSKLAGQLGTSMVALGYLFLVGRLMAVSFIIDAVVFERVGSLSRFLFGLPLVRAIPRRYPVVAHFFDLPVRESDIRPATPPDQS